MAIKKEDSVVELPDNDTLYSAIVAAQLQFLPIVKNRVNPHFKNSYADLDGIYAAIKPALLSNGLFLVSSFSKDENGGTNLVTKLIHAKTGDFISIEYPITLPANDQQKGSTLTYARRYSICALLHLSADDDDDGNGATGKNGGTKEIQPLAYSKTKLLEWAATHTPNAHANDKERALSLEKVCGSNLYDTESKWKILCWENRNRYAPAEVS